ncbi:MAG: hypothetical protein QXZ02_05450 [Candidatus Bathyarchaeia archaeon]
MSEEKLVEVKRCSKCGRELPTDSRPFARTIRAGFKMADNEAIAEALVRKKPRRIIQNQLVIQPSHYTLFLETDSFYRNYRKTLWKPTSSLFHTMQKLIFMLSLIAF